MMKKITRKQFLKLSAATIAAFYLETEISSWLAYYNIYSFASLSLLIFSVVEEVLKFLVVWFFISGSRFFDEPVDYMIYMVTAALGFAALENIGAVLNQWNEFSSLSSIWNTVTLRFIGATLLHSLSSAVLGYYWAYFFYSSRFGQGTSRGYSILGVFIGLLAATLLHAFFNYLIINSDAVIIPTAFLLFFGIIILNDFRKLKIS